MTYLRQPLQNRVRHICTVVREWLWHSNDGGPGWAAHRLLSVWIEAKYLPMLRAAKRFRGRYGELSACVPACATCPVWTVCHGRKCALTCSNLVELTAIEPLTFSMRTRRPRRLLPLIALGTLRISRSRGWGSWLAATPLSKLLRTDCGRWSDQIAGERASAGRARRG